MPGSTENDKLLPPTDTTNFVGQGRNQCHFLNVQMILGIFNLCIYHQWKQRVNFKRKGKWKDIWVQQGRSWLNLDEISKSFSKNSLNSRFPLVKIYHDDFLSSLLASRLRLFGSLAIKLCKPTHYLHWLYFWQDDFCKKNINELTSREQPKTKKPSQLGFSSYKM